MHSGNNDVTSLLSRGSPSRPTVGFSKSMQLSKVQCVCSQCPDTAETHTLTHKGLIAPTYLCIKSHLAFLPGRLISFSLPHVQKQILCRCWATVSGQLYVHRRDQCKKPLQTFISLCPSKLHSPLAVPPSLLTTLILLPHTAAALGPSVSLFFP